MKCQKLSDFDGWSGFFQKLIFVKVKKNPFDICDQIHPWKEKPNEKVMYKV